MSGDSRNVPSPVPVQVPPRRKREAAVAKARVPAGVREGIDQVKRFPRR